jgi:hypothetical protein
MVRTGATVAEAAAEWLRYLEQDRMRKESTHATYQSLLRCHVLPSFSDLPIEYVTPTMIESWISRTDRTPATKTKPLAMMHAITSGRSTGASEKREIARRRSWERL